MSAYTRIQAIEEAVDATADAAGPVAHEGLTRAANQVVRAVRTFYTSSSRAVNGPDAPPLHPACARCRSAPRARRAAGARHGVVVVPWLRPGEEAAHCAEPPPQRQARRRVPIRPAPPRINR
jgi:hypothetical protein